MSHRPATFLPVALATLDTVLPQGAEWTHEVKLDGYRIEAVIEHKADPSVSLYSRSHNDWTTRFPAVVDALTHLPVENAVLDGEIIVPAIAGRSAFQSLQRALEASELHHVHYVLFDLLWLDGVDVRLAPLRERQSLLRAVLRHRTGGSPLRPVRRLSARTGDPLVRACAEGLEGLVSKRLDGRYIGGRHRGWIKVKCTRRQEFVIVGFTEPQGSRSGFGALLLAVYNAEGQLTFVGKVGTGFDADSLTLLHRRLRAIESSTATVPHPSGISRQDVHWVTPTLVAEVAFTEWTDDGRLRHPVFHGVREDKRARDVRREERRHA